MGSEQDLGVPAEVARREGRRRGVVHVATLAVAAFGGALIVRPDPNPPVPLMLPALLAGLFTAAWPARYKARGAVRVHGPNRMLLTAASSAGTRTVDLRRISRVSSFQIPGKGSASQEVLVVRDSRGIRLGLTKPEQFALVGAAVRLQEKKTDIPAPKISRRARRLTEAGDLPWWWGSLSALGTILYVCVVSLVVFGLAINLAVS